ncbi:MAG: DUF5060 domain-containing protein [Kiritimatiellae bacterium]|nr:DUF5060 domain-containing protein [Kiritimatiellia bacterium]
MSATAEQVERWGAFECVLNGPESGNPFTDVELNAEFRFGNRVVPVRGFYDGAGEYRIRLMPDAIGRWTYRTRSNRVELDGATGEFLCTAPAAANHGPVGVAHTYHFAYADGTPYYPIGTTCYVWNHQSDELQAQTLRTLKHAPFNKMRMCVFPKHYIYNQREPARHPCPVNAEGRIDPSRFNPAYFKHLDQRVRDLMQLGIEADIILLHPYDRWGYAEMDAMSDDRYLRYVVARLAAYRNVWWSMANEYDLMKSKTMSDWDRFFKIVQETDPHQHLRGVHNCRGFYDHNKPWVTHQSIQRADMAQVCEWRTACRKPVVVDECRYEGNIQKNWGNIPAREMVHKFWEATVRGGYAGHGETYLHPDDTLWWSHGGILHGQSPERIAFLRQLVEDGPATGLEPAGVWQGMPAAGKANAYYLGYAGNAQPAKALLNLPEPGAYAVDLIDTWEMSVTPLDGPFSGKCEIDLPGKPYTALRIRRRAD